MGAIIHKNTWVIIVHYNGIEWIERCLSSFDNSAFKQQIIVVDNNSPQQEGKELIKKQFPHVKLIELTENIGFGRANNLGIEYAIAQNAEFVFLLNQDAWLIENDCIERLLQVAEQHPDYGIISPVHYNSTKTALDEGFGMYLATSKNWRWASDTFFDKKQEIYEIPFINAAAWLLNVDAFKKIGLFDPDFFMYGEDVNLVNRTLFHQYKIGFVPKASIVHARENRSKSINKSGLSYSEKMQFYGQYLALIKNVRWGFFKAMLKFQALWLTNIITQITQQSWKRGWQILIIGLGLKIKFIQLYSSRQKYKRGFSK
ncbi:glycosyltransferase family 2 protein [Arcicella aquatica]|uniref:Glycosyltransferase family 2 protein n=1 Tax=Arcicella aquatica TaxID=217141 RepID=A0ABU5QV20_9BACT|nr:glycosyltransferase family 2 protein [Arcicella aquatica]MEA5260690.1 glycosyltransferase family 2 protein [Arcicella aquatica]